MWLYLFAEVRGRDRKQQYDPPYCFDRISPEIKILTKSSHPKLPVKFPTQTNPQSGKFQPPQKSFDHTRHSKSGVLPWDLFPFTFLEKRPGDEVVQDRARVEGE